MNRKLMYYLFGVAIGLIVYFMFFKTKNPTAQPVQLPAQTLPTELNVAFDCKSFGTEDLPRTVVNCVINGKTWVLDTVSVAKVLDKTEIQQYKMPDNVLSACGGWWAGSGDYYYIVREGDVLNIYKGWNEEDQADTGFHYVKMKTISASDW
jgi:hypothetical protein